MRRLTLLLAVLGLLAAGCGGDDGVSVDKPWARNSPMMASAGAIYMDLEASEDDRLIGASVDSSIAGKVEIHETAMMDDSMGEEGAMGDEGAMGEEGEMGGEGGQMGAMMMREVGEIALPAGTTVNLKPGGLHIMLLEIAEPLELGEKFDVTLTFENAGEKVVEVEVREEAP
ncbi:MAG: copper chaperone PCu(A)C [Acidimicrobiia bacterium]|nr:copper chaperone PCu(A)C [Acidimicrobiia bacterium]